jgi:hypothetical protein
LIVVGEKMDRDTAIRLQGMAFGVLGNLDAIAHHMKNNLSDDDCSEQMLCVGTALAAISDLLEKLNLRYPDAVPNELQPNQHK